MSERRLTNSERRRRRAAAVEEQKDGRRGILELFREEKPEQPDEDAPLARSDDDDTAA